MIRTITQQLRTLRPLFLCLHVPAILLLIGLAVLCFKRDIPFYLLTRDLADTAKVHPLIGMISNIGMWFWSGAVVMCLFGWAILRDVPHMRQSRAFFGVFGVLTLLLLMDDLFMLHETLIPRHLEISDRKVLLGYLIAFPIGFWFFRKLVAQTKFVLLIIATFCFGFSILIDETHDYFVPDAIHHILEDGAKFIGILTWFSYFFVTCLESVQPRPSVDSHDGEQQPEVLSTRLR